MQKTFVTLKDHQKLEDRLTPLLVQCERDQVTFQKDISDMKQAVLCFDKTIMLKADKSKMLEI